MKNDKKTKSVAVYTTFSQEFIRQMQNKDGKYRLNLLLMRDITANLLKYAYKRYFGIDLNDGEVKNADLFKRSEYGGLYFNCTFGNNFAAAAVGKNPLAIGTMSRPINDERTTDTELLHINELAEYEKSGRSPDALCEIWSKKIAYRKLHGIEKPQDDDPFDNSFQKDIDGTLGTYSLHRFDCDGYTSFLAVTGEAEFVEVNIDDIV